MWSGIATTHKPRPVTTTRIDSVESKRLCETLTLVLRYLWMEQTTHETLCYLLSSYSELWEIPTQRPTVFMLQTFVCGVQWVQHWVSADSLTEVKRYFLRPCTYLSHTPSTRGNSIYLVARIYLRSRNPRLTAVGIRCADHGTPSTHKRLALTSPTSGGL
jgi:hypothetical protein